MLAAFVLPAEYGKDPPERQKTYKVEASAMPLAPGMAFEYKYRLDQGASMVYAWSTETPVKYEFHGEPDDSRLKVVSYEKQVGDQSAGSLTAAFTGIHGWYWKTSASSRSRSPFTVPASSHRPTRCGRNSISKSTRCARSTSSTRSPNRPNDYRESPRSNHATSQ